MPYRHFGQRYLGSGATQGGPADWNKPIWQLDLSKGLRILRLGIDTHLITSHYLLPLLIERPGRRRLSRLLQAGFDQR